MAVDQRTFVLVHGAWHGGWCWRRVADRLIARGHRVFAPTLTGVGERSHLQHDGIDLSTHIEDVVQLIRYESLTDIVLVGHSYGGLVISGAVERVGDAVASIVFVDAFVPDDGMSLSDYWPPERKLEYETLAAITGFRSVPPLSAEFFGVNERDRSWVDAKCVPHPYACFTEKVRLSGARERIPKKTYVRAGGYPSVYFSKFHARLKADPTWRVHTLPCGHDIMVDMPEELAEILEHAA
jgi:pimeloyl-ACP methyl ester carboxylesterase